MLDAFVVQNLNSGERNYFGDRKAPWDWKPSSGQMMLLIAHNITLFVPTGGCSAVDVRDVACGIIAAYDYGKTGERYILGGQNISYLDLWRKIKKLVGRPGPLVNVPGFLNSLSGRCGDLIGKVIGNELPLNTAMTTQGAMFNYYTSAKAEKELGYQIGPLDTALEDAWAWFKKYGYTKRKY